MTLYTCTHPTCDRRSGRKNYCIRHLEQVRAGLEPTDIPRRAVAPALCAYPDCGRPHYAKGWCRPHSVQALRGAGMSPVGDRTRARAAVSARWQAMTAEERRAATAKMREGGSYPRTDEWRDARSESMKKHWAERGPRGRGQRACDVCGGAFAPAGWRQVRCSPACAEVAVKANRYGLSIAAVAALGDTCAICGTEKHLHIDHCHTTGRVRGRLCVTCNTALGKFNDDPALLRAAADYLERGTI